MSNRFSSQPVHKADRYSMVSIRAIGVAISLFVLANVLGLAGVASPGHALFRTIGVLIMIGGIVAVGSGLTAIIRDGDRSIVTFLMTAFGGLLAWFMFFEMFIGHE
jgi:hypothetical protein